MISSKAISKIIAVIAVIVIVIAVAATTLLLTPRPSQPQTLTTPATSPPTTPISSPTSPTPSPTTTPTTPSPIQPIVNFKVGAYAEYIMKELEDDELTVMGTYKLSVDGEENYKGNLCWLLSMTITQRGGCKDDDNLVDY